MNIEDLSKKVSKEFKLPKTTSRKILSFVFKEIFNALVFGTNISIGNFGKFELIIREPKRFTNFKTGEISYSSKRYAIKFTPYSKLNERIKSKTVY